MQELRQGKYQKLILADPPALRTVAALGLPVESSAGASSAAALPPVSVQQLMVDHRRLDLLQPFKLALLKLASQVRAAGAATGAAGLRMQRSRRHARLAPAACQRRSTQIECLGFRSQEAARLMAQGEYEAALPVALDAVKQVRRARQRARRAAQRAQAPNQRRTPRARLRAARMITLSGRPDALH